MDWGMDDPSLTEIFEAPVNPVLRAAHVAATKEANDAIARFVARRRAENGGVDTAQIEAREDWEAPNVCDDDGWGWGR